jgi:hypothetical protein
MKLAMALRLRALEEGCESNIYGAFQSGGGQDSSTFYTRYALPAWRRGVRKVDKMASGDATGAPPWGV